MEKALQTMIDNMPAKTGKSLDEWKSLLKTKSFAKHSEGVKFLKEAHGVTHGFANTIASLSKEESNSPDDLVKNQYEGKESLKPIYKKLVKLVKKFGGDVKITPKKTEVSLDRSKKFGVIRPSTKTRIDLGLKIKGKAISDRLENSGPKSGKLCTQNLPLENQYLSFYLCFT